MSGGKDASQHSALQPCVVGSCTSHEGDSVARLLLHCTAIDVCSSNEKNCRCVVWLH